MKHTRTRTLTHIYIHLPPSTHQDGLQHHQFFLHHGHHALRLRQLVQSNLQPIFLSRRLRPLARNQLSKRREELEIRGGSDVVASSQDVVEGEGGVFDGQVDELEHGDGVELLLAETELLAWGWGEWGGGVDGDVGGVGEGRMGLGVWLV